MMLGNGTRQKNLHPYRTRPLGGGGRRPPPLKMKVLLSKLKKMFRSSFEKKKCLECSGTKEYANIFCERIR